MKITVLYVGSSLLAPLKKAEQEINCAYDLKLRVAAYNFGSPLCDSDWEKIDRDLRDSSIVFVIHVIDQENSYRLISSLERYQDRHKAVIVINCMPDLMRRTRMGRLDIAALSRAKKDDQRPPRKLRQARAMLTAAGTWVGNQARAYRKDKRSNNGHTQYVKLIDHLPGILKFVPTAGALTDAKHYLYLFCYFLQPTPGNIKAMLLYALQQYASNSEFRAVKLRVPPPERLPAVAIYHPSAPKLFETFDSFEKWYLKYRAGTGLSKKRVSLDRTATIGLLLMRPQVVSGTTKHYDTLISELEAQGLSVIPAIATLMDNRQAVGKFFIEASKGPRVSQIVSLTGFSFVGGPAMNDSDAATAFLSELNIPYRAAVSLDTQTIEAWSESQTGLNPVQAGMQIAIPEIDGATEPFVYGGIPARGQEPIALEERCNRFAKRLRRWNRLRTAARSEIKLALVLFCFPPNKGNIGTAADLDVFPSVWSLLRHLEKDGYTVNVPGSADELREALIEGNSERFGAAANVVYRMKTNEYRRLCPYVREVEKEWGPAPGAINSFGEELLIQGLELGNVFLGVQPTFGFEGDPMRLMMARSGSPHHGFMAFYTYLSKVVNADAVVHVGTHGAMEFMPGKQVGLSSNCWSDRLIGELPNLYIYSVNNPSEGSIAKRRSYAELISYLTPPIEDAGLYKDLAALKDLLLAYRQSDSEAERERLFQSIAVMRETLHFEVQN